MIYEKQRIIKISSNDSARKYNNWYKDLIGYTFEPIMYDICSAEYLVSHNDKILPLPDSDIEIVSF